MSTSLTISHFALPGRPRDECRQTDRREAAESLLNGGPNGSHATFCATAMIRETSEIDPVAPHFEKQQHLGILVHHSSHLRIALDL